MDKSNNVNLYSLSRNREVIFLETIEELKLRVNKKEKSAYNIIRMGAILRLLFIDGSNLFNAININYKVKCGAPLLCSVNDISGISTFQKEKDHTQFLTFGIREDGDHYNIQSFLGVKVVYLDIPNLDKNSDNRHIQFEYNNRELIKLIANAHGGVHLEKWNSDIHFFLSSHPMSPYNINENSDFHGILKNVSEILLGMIKPLEEKVRLNLQNTKPVAYQSINEQNIVSVVGLKSKR